jgi:glutamate:Na+ symporter, ESS family
MVKKSWPFLWIDGQGGEMQFDSFVTLNLAILVLALGKFLNRRIGFLRDFNIPEPVSSGLLVCILLAVVYATTGTAVSFNLQTRDFLLLYFFAGIGLNSDFKTLASGGKPLLVLLVLTIGFQFLQNFTGIGVASLMGLEPITGLLGGTVSLIGGHGTAIAWAPIFSEQYGIDSAMEIAIACATVGLVLSSLMGGPIAKILIARHNLQPSAPAELDVGVAYEQSETKPDINSFAVLRTLFWLNMSLVLGQVIQQFLESMGAGLPLFVCCLFGGILLTNSVPRVARIEWPARSRSLAIISDMALGVFLAMSLMSLQLWTIVDLAGPIFFMLGAQFVVAFLFALFLVFRFMGRDYEAAVICSGFGGISLGATPTAMANMTAVSQKFGPAHRAFIIVPLVSGFFVDISNALIIRRFLEWFA